MFAQRARERRRVANKRHQAATLATCRVVALELAKASHGFESARRADLAQLNGGEDAQTTLPATWLP